LNESSFNRWSDAVQRVPCLNQEDCEEWFSSLTDRYRVQQKNQFEKYIYVLIFNKQQPYEQKFYVNITLKF